MTPTTTGPAAGPAAGPAPLRPVTRSHVVLVGAGHANLLLLRRARRLLRHGVAVTLVDPGAFLYSGMVAAATGGVVHPGRDRVDPAPLARTRGVRVVAGSVVGLDPEARTVEVDDGTTLRASAIVLNVGSDLDDRGLPRDHPSVVGTKPLTGLLALRDDLAVRTRGARVVVVGAGASAVELACNLAAGPVAALAEPSVTLVGPAPLVPVVGDGPRAAIHAALARRGVEVVDARVDDLTTGSHGEVDVLLEDGSTRRADRVVLATGLRASATVEALGLGDRDGMPTTRALHHPAHPWLFGAGDAIRFDRDGLPRLGVFAVRQAPVLLDNLLALHGHGRTQTYEPQETWVAALDLADGEALVMRGDRWFAGRTALVVKRALDEWFLRRHRVPLGASGRSWGHPLP